MVGVGPWGPQSEPQYRPDGAMLSSKSYEYKIHVHLVVFVTCYHDLAWCSSNGAGMVGSKIKKDKYDPPPDSIQDEASSQKEKEDKVR
jgi:hypothetical protein